MKRMLGFIIFWIAIGMTIMFFMTNNLLAMIINYNLSDLRL